jgi:hypothetical protein
MRILLAYHSRSGHTERLAQAIAAELCARGHDLAIEKIQVAAPRSKWRLALPLLTTLPVLPFYLCLKPVRTWWLRRYHQPEQAIVAPEFADVSGFDRVCIGGPKWLYIAYPVARYLRDLNGLRDKRIGAFASFCGPPLQVFELEMLFDPLRRRIGEKQGMLTTTMAVSSHYHEFFFLSEMEYLFRMLSWLCFRRPLRAFTLDSQWGRAEVQRFCNELLETNVETRGLEQEQVHERQEQAAGQPRQAADNA